MVLLGALHFPESPENSSLVEDSLLQQVAEGNQEAFQQLYQHTDRAVYGFILSVVKTFICLPPIHFISCLYSTKILGILQPFYSKFTKYSLQSND